MKWKSFSSRNFKRRTKKFMLKGDVHLEIGWHHGLDTHVAEFTLKNGKWAAVYDTDMHALIGKVRIGIAEMINPEVRTVRWRVLGIPVPPEGFE